MNSHRRLITASFACLMSACATLSTSRSFNPWQFPNRDYRISSIAEQVRLLASMEPCNEYARDTFPETLRRYENGSLEGAKLIATVFDDEKLNSQLKVHVAEGEQIHGRMSGKHVIRGKLYAAGDEVSVNTADIVDWYVIPRSGPPEGNFIGKYLLLKQDGFEPGDCNPNDIEFQRYRYFSINYSFVPPGTDGWEMRGPGDGWDMSMHNEGQSPDELNTLSSFRQRIPVIDSMQKLIAKTRTHMGYGPETADRYTVLEHKVEAFTKKEALCALSQQVIHDNEALLVSLKRVSMTREVQTLLCVHPYDKSIGIKLNYSHLYYSGNRGAEFIDRAKKVSESLAFTKSY